MGGVFQGRPGVIVGPHRNIRSCQHRRPGGGVLANQARQVVDRYLRLRSTNAGTAWAWPEGVLPILTWGCGMYACVDCRSDNGTVLLFEPNPGDPDQAWYVDSDSLEEWFEHHVNDTGWWSKAENGEEPENLQPWTDARTRASR